MYTEDFSSRRKQLSYYIVWVGDYDNDCLQFGKDITKKSKRLFLLNTLYIDTHKPTSPCEGYSSV